MDFSPHQFGKYRLVYPLAVGGMAEVFIAKQQGPAGFEKTVVIKRILPVLSENPDFVQMFLDEARLAAQLSHPNIAQVFDFGEADGAYYLAMEYLCGADLVSIHRNLLIRGQQMPAQVAAIIASAAADALHYAHTFVDERRRPLRVVHRDVSPSNILVTFQGVTKVLDFGIAKADGKLGHTQVGRVKGKFAYMSPEQMRGLPLDGRSDVYSLGLVLHEALTGVPLNRGKNEKALLELVAKRTSFPSPRVARPELPDELCDITLKALEHDRERRYQTAQAMRLDLERHLANLTYQPSVELLREFLRGQFGEEEMARRARLGAGDPASQPPAPVSPSQPVPAMPDQTLRPGPSRRWSRPLAIGAAVAGAMAIGFWAKRAPEPGQLATIAPLAPAAAAPAAPVPAEKPPGDDAARPAGTTGPAVAVTEPRAVVPPLAPLTSPLATHTARAVPTFKHPLRPAIAPPPADRATEAAPGSLDVNCIPWCRVYLDGRDTGLESPALGIELAPGAHRLRVVNPPTGLQRELDVEITSGKPRREVIHL